MKVRPVSHKNENIFKFQTFAERLSNINIDVIHRIGQTSQLPEDSDCFFQETLDKWEDLNYSDDYNELRKDIGFEVRSLTQLLHRQDELVAVLQKHLKNEKSLAMDAVLELVVALARDLQFDFYPHFPDFFVLIVDLATTRDTERLEKIFSCISYLFKFLWRYMVKDIHNVYKLYSPLLSSERKDYIRTFAAESFAFLMRKVPDKTKLFEMIFKRLDKKPDQAEGVGHLLFEMIKGVTKQFHSCTETVFSTMLQLLGNNVPGFEDVPLSLVQTALSQTVCSMAQHTSVEFSSSILEIFCDSMMKIVESESPDRADHMERLLSVFMEFVSFHNASLVSKPSSVILVLIAVLKLDNLSEVSVRHLLNSVSLLLLYKDALLNAVEVGNVLNTVFESCASTELIFEFTKKLFSHQMFEKQVLPLLLIYCQCKLSLTIGDADASAAVVGILTDLILNKRAFLTSGKDLCRWSTYPLNSNFSTGDKEMAEEEEIQPILLNYLSFGFGENIEENFQHFWASLVCIPHFRFMDKLDLVKGNLRKATENLHKKLTEEWNVSDEIWETGAFLLAETVSTFVHVDSAAASETFTASLFVDLLTKKCSSTNVLRALDLYLTDATSSNQSDNSLSSFLESAFPLLQPNLASPYHQVRFLTLRILCSFDLPLPKLDDETVVQLSVFKICLAAEEIPVTVQDYREKLKYLQKLEFEAVRHNIPIGSYHSVPVYYLLGMLYVNFKLIWQPSQKLLESHAKGMGKPFWEVFTLHLKEIATLCERTLFDNVSKSHAADSSASASRDCLQELFRNTLHISHQTNDSPDHQNHRMLLWQAMEGFSEESEPRNRELVPLLLDFTKNEFLPSDIILSGKEDIRTDSRSMMVASGKKTLKRKRTLRHSFRKNHENDDKVLDQAEDAVELTVGKSFEEAEPSLRTKRASSKLLCSHLSVFAKFKNPRALFREQELHKLYLDLLKHRDDSVQKVAFECLMTYKPKCLLPYKSNFSNLLDDKTFKTEIVMFSIDSEHGVVHSEDRHELLPILMRILYGKMLRKTGANTSGKSNAQLRRSIVLRFLGGCSEEELQVFLGLVFDPFLEIASENILEVVRKTKEVLDLSSVVPIKRMLSILNTLGVVFGQLGNILSKSLPWLLKILLAMASLASAILEFRSQVHPSQVLLLKSLRTQTTDRLIQFFITFDQYPFAEVEIEAIFEAAVWPLLPHLQNEALYHPPPLLRLLAMWSQNPRYFPLLGKARSADFDLNPLRQLLSLYTAEKVQFVVIKKITEILCNLLTYRDYVQDAEDDDGARQGPAIVVNCPAVLPLEGFSQLDEFPNYGTLLLLPYVPKILQRLEMLIRRAVRNPKKLLSSEELTILTRISEHVRDGEQCGNLFTLLIPFLTKTKARNPETEVKILTTMRNLVKYAEKRNQFIRPLASLFSSLSSRQSRSALCSVFTAIGELDSSRTVLASVVEKMNAWNPKQTEEPDYNVRLKGHREAQHVFGNMDDELDVDFILVVIHNCSFFIRSAEDLSLRDNSCYTLQLLSEKLSGVMDTQKAAFRILISEALLDEIKKGLRNKNEVVRHEFVTVLASVLRHCGSHQKLKGLYQLSDSDVDLDFWENIRHIQLHRRARALVRVARGLVSNTLDIHAALLTSYVMPLATAFLFDTAYTKHSNLVDAAVELVGAVCQRLSWQQYETTLKYYIGQLTKNTEFHKLVVKIVVAVLNAFHFDLSNSRGMETSNLLSRNRSSLEKEADDKTVDNEKESLETALELEVVEEEGNSAVDGQKLSEEAATKIHSSIVKHLLPQLHRCLTQRTKREQEHKLLQESYPEDEEILRIPIALAMVKLLQNLPHGMLERNLSGIFLKVVHLLRSRADSIRESTREMLIKMMQSLGPKYFRFLLHEMKSIMKRGYQVHVMTYTIHSVLSNLIPHLKVGDLDCCIDSLTQVCQQELFGEAAEEKEVEKIVGKLKEARSSKSYYTYQIMARFVSESALEKLVFPLKEALAGTHSHRSVRKLQDCLRHIVLGLADNTDLQAKNLLIFVHRIVSSGIQDLKPGEKLKVAEQRLKQPDVYLIPKEPKRGGNPAKITVKTNAHVLVDFGLQLLHFLLKREKLQPTCKEHLEMLDPFAPILSSSLDSQHVKVISTTLRCLSWLLKFPLPSLESHIKGITNCVFVLLNKFSGAGMGQGDNFEMVVMCFKVLTVIIRDILYHEVTSKQLRVLLIYVDQDINDHTRRATAFTLLKAILSRRLEAEELPDIMKKISEMSIASEQEHLRTQSRQVFLQYLLEYPLGKALPKYLGFYVLQLEYEHEFGRQSALEMLNSMFASFPYGLLRKHSGLFFLPLAAQLVNDASSKCRQMVATAIKNLLTKLEDNDRTLLFSVVTTWLQSTKTDHQRLGAQLCGLFAEAEADKFAGRVATVLPLLKSLLDPDNYKNTEFQETERNVDHLLYHLLNSLLKILSSGSVIRNAKHQSDVAVVWGYVRQHLQHPHVWVQLVSSQLFGLLFAAYTPEELAKAADTTPNLKDYLLTESCQKILDLSADFCIQFRGQKLSEKLGEQIIRNQVYLAKTILHLQPDKGKKDGITQKPTVMWMFRRLCRDLNAEVALSPKITLKRTCVFKWIAAVALEMENVADYLHAFLPPLCRDLADNSPYTDQELKTLAQEVVDLLRSRSSVDRFSEEYVRVQSSLSTKKSTRKRKKALDAVSNPEVSARRKIKRHLSKKEAKKRKIELQKGVRPRGKKPRLSELVITS